MTKHVPVLKDEVIKALKVKDGGQYLDATVGYGGHSEALLQSGKNIKLTCVDRDADALEFSKNRLKGDVNFIHAGYDEVIEGEFDGILLDLGVSSPQLDEEERGFSLKGGPLDMRFDVRGSQTAADILNTYPAKKLAEIFKKFGEERYALKIARSIENFRQEQTFERTSQLRELIEATIPKKMWPKTIHPATRVFQALRIEVNEELSRLENALPQLVQLLKPGGRIAIITFHSLEDRIVKHFLRDAAKECICPKSFPVCVCEKEVLVKVITKKPILPTKTEIKNNVRSRSAKLRVAERL